MSSVIFSRHVDHVIDLPDHCCRPSAQGRLKDLGTNIRRTTDRPLGKKIGRWPAAGRKEELIKAEDHRRQDSVTERTLSLSSTRQMYEQIIGEGESFHRSRSQIFLNATEPGNPPV